MKVRKGFTLIELLVVVAIIGILVTIAIPRFAGMTDGAKEKAWNANHQELISAVTLYMADHNGFTPQQVSDLDPYIMGNGQPLADGSGPAGDVLAYLKDRPKGADYSIDWGDPNDPVNSPLTITSKLGSYPDLVWQP